MSGAPGSHTAVSFSTNPGEGYNLMRQVLVRMVLAVRQASLFRRSWSPEGKGELCLALAPICPTPHVSAGGHPPEGLAWSRLIDLEHLAGEIGMPVMDLEAFAAEHPAAPWRLLQLRTSPRILAMLPGSPPDAWERRDAESDPIGCRCRPANWLRWSSVEAIDAFFSPESNFLARETFSHPGHEVGGIFLSHAETMNWGSTFDSVAYWRVIAALRPAPLIRARAARLRPRGAYLGVHWRRGDFRQVHPDHSPSPAIAAEQIIAHARTHGLPTVFVATDAENDEIAALRGPVEAAGLTFVTLEPDSVPDLCDLERAVLEQTMLFESTVFVGTRSSTFSHTVFETREASQAWEPETTSVAAWNVLCGDAQRFGPVEPRRAFKPGAKRTEPVRSLDPVRIVLSDPLHPGVEVPAAAGKRWTDSGARDVHLLKEFSGGKPGAWTILPTLPALAESLAPAVEWVFFAPADFAVNPQKIATWLGRRDGHSGGFVGRALHDSRPTAIHHYRQDQLAYPDFRCGFALSRSLLLPLAERWKSRKPTAGFHIDAAYELAVAVEACGFRLTDEPRLAGLIPVPPSPASPVDPDEVVFAIKTHGGNHLSRIPVLQRTWGREARHLVFYSDVHDPSIPTIPVGLPNSPRGHGEKFHVIARHLRGHHGDREWFVIADDDTLLSVPRLMELLGAYTDCRDEPVFLGQRYGYGHHLPDGGYDYLTMGAGMVMNRRGLFALLEANDPPDIDEPDDMWVGRCLEKMGIEVVHHEGFHQEPPGAYPPAILAGQEAVSFHRHAPDNPDEVYAKYLAPEAE